jgi:LPXTG-site transpeptidase (sortase) family protein
LHTVSTIKPAASGYFIVGWLIIPRLGVKCSIRSDTVNAYNAAYHYPQSAAFGQPGECGLMSHRTTYSALFRHLEMLRVGDRVTVINLQKTRYTYAVTSNGKDIRWDYKTNPIQFANSGTARLLLVTCYPTGYERAAFITHCKLYSVDYLPRVLATNPQNLKINTSRTSTLIVKFSERIKINPYSTKIRVKNLKTNKYVSISEIIHGNMLYIKTASKRSAYTWYQVIIPNGTIKDSTGNYLRASYAFKFKTGA